MVGPFKTFSVSYIGELCRHIMPQQPSQKVSLSLVLHCDTICDMYIMSCLYFVTCILCLVCMVVRHIFKTSSGVTNYLSFMMNVAYIFSDDPLVLLQLTKAPYTYISGKPSSTDIIYWSHHPHTSYGNIILTKFQLQTKSKQCSKSQGKGLILRNCIHTSKTS